MKCAICNAENVVKIEESFFSDDEITSFLEHVRNKEITPESMDVFQYMKLSKKMAAAIEEGFGTPLIALSNGSHDYNLLRDFIKDGYGFCAAKQYHLVLELTALIKRPQAEFYQEGKKVFLKYNVQFFNAELDSAEQQAKNGREFGQLIDWHNG